MNPGMQLRIEQKTLDNFKKACEEFLPHFIAIDLGLPKQFSYEFGLFFNILKLKFDWSNIQYDTPDLDIPGIQIDFTRPIADKSLVSVKFPALKQWEIKANQHIDFWFLPDDSPVRLVFKDFKLDFTTNIILGNNGYLQPVVFDCDIKFGDSYLYHDNPLTAFVMHQIIYFGIIILENSVWLIGTYVFTEMGGPVLDSFFNHYQFDFALSGLIQGQTDKIDNFSLDYRQTASPYIGNGYADFYFSGEIIYNGEGCDIEHDYMDFLNNEVFSQLVISQSAATCILNKFTKSSIGQIDLDQKRWNDLFSQNNLNFSTTTLHQYLPIFEEKLGKNVLLKAKIIFKDLNVTFGKFNSDIIVEYLLSYTLWEEVSQKILISDELPMITSMNMKMKNNIVYLDVLEHKIASHLIQSKNTPNMNWMHLTNIEYREFLSAFSFFQNYLKKWMNVVYLKNGLVMPYNPKELYTSVAFKEQSLHILLEVEDQAQEFLERKFWDEDYKKIQQREKSLYYILDQNMHAEYFKCFGQNKEICYKTFVNGGSIFANPQNEQLQQPQIGVNSITIENYQGNDDVDFACYISKDSRRVSNLTIQNEKHLTFTMNDYQKIDLSNMNVIHYGNSKKNINLCLDNVNQMTKYKWSGDIKVSGNNFTATLVSDYKFVQSLKVNFLLLATPKGDTVSVTWNYKNQTLASKTFKFPEEVINMTVVFKLTGLILDGYLNVIQSQAIINKNEPGIIGLGENVGNQLYLQKGVYSMWARDYADPVQQAKLPAANLYSTHPFYMGMDTQENWFGIFTKLASAQDWWIDYAQVEKAKTTSIETISVGNAFGEMYFFFADTAPELISTYHKNIIGVPVLTPFWALGWNQCRWGYKNDKMMREVYENYNRYNIPLDTLWSDIDYLDDYKDFTYDKFNFDGLPQLISDLHSDNKRYIPIIDAGIAQRPNQNYAPYDEGLKNGYFITYDKDKDAITGQVWPGDATFPDFTQINTKKYWQSWLTTMEKEIPFDGLWLDMNEVANFQDGVFKQNQKVNKSVKNLLPYQPTGRDLEKSSLSLDAYHKGNDAIELDMHSLFGTLQVATTSDWFIQNKKRPMIIERSGFAGIGKYGSRWMGDNWSKQDYMGYSLVGVQAHNIYGIPLVGSDICGFLGNTSIELCARWHVVGSFYPFSRNHNEKLNIPQEPWVFNDIYEGITTYSDIMFDAIRNKYRLAKYYYTQMYLLSKNGGSFIQPLFFQFPQDVNSREDLQYNMMIGEALKLGINSNRLDQNVTQIIFPQNAIWCKLLQTRSGKENCIIGGSNKLDRSSKAYDFDLHLRDGYIVPLQDVEKVLSTHDLLQKPVELHINLRCVADANQINVCNAKGILINDDGVTLINDPLYKSVTFNIKLITDPFSDGKQTQKMSLVAIKDQPSDYDCKNNFLSQVYIHNADNLFKDVIYTVFVQGKRIGETMVEKESNRLVLDLSSQPVNLSKLDATGIVFKIKK